MDMRKNLKHFRRWLTFAVLEAMGDVYVGTIADVVNENVRHPDTTVVQSLPVIRFEDGYRISPRLGIFELLMGTWGPETDTWSGHRLRLTQGWEHRERKDGTSYAVPRWEAEIVDDDEE